MAGRTASRESVVQDRYGVIEGMVEVGPGSMRVGRFIGRLGVVTMPAIERGLGLADRVVRRHVAKLQAVGWCERTPALRGYGSLVWMTATGLNGIGLVDLPALRAPDPFSIQTMRTVRVAWVAADIEAAGHQWHAARELALAPDRWGAQVNNERGGKSRRLPDLVFWPASDNGLPVAVVVVHGPPKPRRERAALEGWQGSIAAGQYAQVRFVAGPAAAGRLEGVAALGVGLADTQLIAGDRVVTDESPVPAETLESVAEASTSAEATPVAVPDPPPPVPVHTPRPSRPQGPAATPEQAVERQKLIRELLGQEDPPARRRWRRRSA
jgi:hypothetical protein